MTSIKDVAGNAAGDRKKATGTKRLKDIASWKLALLGSVCASEVELAREMFSRVRPLYFDAVQSGEIFSPLGLMVSLQLMGFVLITCVLAAFATRCGALLYQRHVV